MVCTCIVISNSICAVKTLLGVNGKILSLRRELILRILLIFYLEHNHVQARSQDFLKGGLRRCLMCMYAYINKQAGKTRVCEMQMLSLTSQGVVTYMSPVEAFVTRIKILISKKCA